MNENMPNNQDFTKFIEAEFRHLNDSVSELKKDAKDFRVEMREGVKDLRKEFITQEEFSPWKKIVESNTKLILEIRDEVTKSTVKQGAVIGIVAAIGNAILILILSQINFFK